jgi:hypothetical protein
MCLHIDQALDRSRGFARLRVTIPGTVVAFEHRNRTAGTHKPAQFQPMSFIWGVFKAIMLFFSVIIAALVVIDGSLLANLKKKPD